MNIKNIKTLVNIISNSNLTVLEVAEGEYKIRLEKASSESTVNGTRISYIEKKSQQAEFTETNTSPEDGNNTSKNNIIEVKAPLVGVFYSAPSADASPFVTIGKKIKKGDVVGVIEVMKVMNEILAESDGEVVDVCVKNGDLVEFGQTLIKMS